MSILLACSSTTLIPKSHGTATWLTAVTTIIVDKHAISTNDQHPTSLLWFVVSTTIISSRQGLDYTPYTDKFTAEYTTYLV